MNGKLAVCAAGLFLVILLGCKSTDVAGFFALQSDATGRERVVDGAVDVVALSAQSKFAELGIQATSTRDGESVRLQCKNANGVKFNVVFTRDAESAKSGKTRTNVRFDWTDKDDVQLALQIFTHLDKPPVQK